MEEQEAEEEVDQEEVEELREAAGRELRAAAAALFGLPFEDKAKIFGALPPIAAAALTGKISDLPMLEHLDGIISPSGYRVVSLLNRGSGGFLHDAVFEAAVAGTQSGKITHGMGCPKT